VTRKEVVGGVLLLVCLNQLLPMFLLVASPFFCAAMEAKRLFAAVWYSPSLPLI
jgi:hypothetical protein